jgi:hypothetical protein
MSDQPIRRLRRSHPTCGKDIATRTHNSSCDTLDRMRPVFADSYAACEVWGKEKSLSLKASKSDAGCDFGYACHNAFGRQPDERPLPQDAQDVR